VRTFTEDLENEPGAVEHLGVPLLLEISLLYRRQRVIDDDEAGFGCLDDACEFLDGAFAEKRCRLRPCDRNDGAVRDVQVDRPGKPLDLDQPVRRRTLASALTRLRAARPRFQFGFENNRPRRFGDMLDCRSPVRTKPFAWVVGMFRQPVFAGASSLSNMFTGWPGMIVEIACL
jgi:hypothetical protein